MLLFIERNNELFILLTKRAQHLKHHPGQISFPGGKVEQQDEDMIATAIRETFEEVGITVTRDNILGQLAPLPTLSGYLIYPIVGFAKSSQAILLDQNEVELIFELPLTHLTTKPSLVYQSFLRHQQPFPLCATYYDPHLIWGATAQILRVLIKQINR